MSRRNIVKLKPHSSKQNESFSITGVGDYSTTLAPTELQHMLDLHHSSSFGQLGASINAAARDGMSERSVMLERTQQTVLLTEKADMLFPQFLEVLQGRTNDSEVFDTIQDLIQICAGVLEDMQREMLQVRDGRNNEKITNILWLEQELKTWKLLYALYKDRVMLQGEAGGGMDCDVPPLGGSEKEVIAQLYSCNSTLREYQLIVDWLEACYENLNSGSHVGYATDQTVGWENTLFQLQNRENLAFSTGTEIVKSLDPDAPIREKRPLHALDEEDNLRLSKCIFTEIRQGRIEEAMALCKHCGQTWRAAILEGWRLHEDPNYEGVSSSQSNTRAKNPIEGNPRRDIWKKCAWLMADSKKFDEYTRAIAGAFCGHLESMKALLGDSWEDLLWAYLKVQIDIRVESEIRACCIKAYHQMPDVYWNGKMSLEQIFDELAVHNDAVVRDYAQSKVAIIQKYLILDNIADLLLQIRRWVDDACGDGDTKPLSPHMLRFLSHIVLFMRQIGRVDKEETAERIISAYVECLIGQGDAQLVAFYTAALPSKLQMLLYSKFLEDITESSARSTALKEAINAGLDVESITRHTVETLRLREPTDTEAPEQSLAVGEISVFDQRKIDALEWLTFLPTQRGDLLWQANAMIRTFLGQEKTECVRAAFEKVPLDSLAQIVSMYGSKDNFPCREECSIKEYISYKIYLTAIDQFNVWSCLYHNRPKEPQTANADANFTERVAAEHKVHAYRAELNRWTNGLDEQAKITRDALYNILLCPEKGWLNDPDMPKEVVAISELDWENRQVQLEKLRSIVIPEIVLLLHQVLHYSGDYRGCVKLADEIADESHQIYKVYTKHKLAELLSKIAESSLELLNQKLDPWGFTVTA